MRSVEQLLMKHEGFRKNMYKCSQGFNTIGYGFNLDVGISEELSLIMLRHQIVEIRMDCLATFPWYKNLNEVRRAVVLDMVYNLGMSGFKKFKKTIGYLESGDYILAGEEMLDSLWARQVNSRAIDLYEMMQSGEWV